MITMRWVEADPDGNWVDRGSEESAGNGVFALFADKKYAVAIDATYKIREKAGVVVDAFMRKGGRKDKDALSAEVAKAIEEAGD